MACVRAWKARLPPIRRDLVCARLESAPTDPFQNNSRRALPRLDALGKNNSVFGFDANNRKSTTAPLCRARAPDLDRLKSGNLKLQKRRKENNQ